MFSMDLAYIENDLRQYGLMPFVHTIEVEGVGVIVGEASANTTLPEMDDAKRMTGVAYAMFRPEGEDTEIGFLRENTSPTDSSIEPVNFIVRETDFAHLDVQDRPVAMVLGAAVESSIHEGFERFAATDGWTESRWFPHDKGEFPEVRVRLVFDDESYSAYICFS